MHRNVSHAGDDEHGKSPAVWTVGALALLLILPIGSRRPRKAAQESCHLVDQW